jgi:hypothetical protein
MISDDGKKLCENSCDAINVACRQMLVKLSPALIHAETFSDKIFEIIQVLF